MMAFCPSAEGCAAMAVEDNQIFVAVDSVRHTAESFRARQANQLWHDVRHVSYIRSQLQLACSHNQHLHFGVRPH